MRSSYNYINEYLNKVQSKGRYAITLSELKERFNSSEKAIKQIVYRLKSKNQLAHVRKEFYVIIPPQYSNRGMVPPSLFIDDLMNYLNKEYYVGALSAAALHGAGHQQPMQFQLMVKKPALRSIQNDKLNIHFFVKSQWNAEDIVAKKTETGSINCSSPSLTAFDLIHYSKQIGGINRILPILEELLESIHPSELSRTATHQKLSDVQRLGFLVEELGEERLAIALFRQIEKTRLNAVPISLAHRPRWGILHEKWKVIINTELDY